MCQNNRNVCQFKSTVATSLYLDAFSASRSGGFAKTLIFKVFLLEFWIFHLSFLGFLSVPFNFWIILQVFQYLEQALFRSILNFCIQIWHFIEIFAVCESIFVGFKKTKIVNLQKPWVFSWVLSFFLDLLSYFLSFKKETNFPIRIEYLCSFWKEN